MNTPGLDPASQFGQDVASGIGQFPAFQQISPIVEYLLQMLSGSQQQKPFKSYELEGRPNPAQSMGPRPNPALKGQMMQRPTTDTTY